MLAVKKYTAEIIERIRQLRSDGLTYREINQRLGSAVPKSSLTYMCADIEPQGGYHERIRDSNLTRLDFVRELAIKKNREIFNAKLDDMRQRSLYAADAVKDPEIAKIALAMLYLGEGSKWKSTRGLRLGSSDPQIIVTYIRLLEVCFGVERVRLRARIQHRADQDAEELLGYWHEVTSIPKQHFQKSYADRRTIGHPTMHANYKGVCTIIGGGTYVQLELSIIAGIIGETMGH